jgi:hypothetical protein
MSKNTIQIMTARPAMDPTTIPATAPPLIGLVEAATAGGYDVVLAIDAVLVRAEDAAEMEALSEWLCVGLVPGVAVLLEDEVVESVTVAKTETSYPA